MLNEAPSHCLRVSLFLGTSGVVFVNVKKMKRNKTKCPVVVKLGPDNPPQ